MHSPDLIRWLINPARSRFRSSRRPRRGMAHRTVATWLDQRPAPKSAVGRSAAEGADGAESIALGLPDLASVSPGRSRMRALQGTDGDRGGADVEGGDYARPGTSWAVGGRARFAPGASA